MREMVTRRRALLASATAGIGLLAACRKKEVAASSGVAASPVSPSGMGPDGPDGREGADFFPVEVDESLVVRKIAGLRPFRSEGFVVRREEVGEKILVHNYGHGGGGISLSWGSSHLAAELAGSVSGVECAVVGGGVMGLSTARLLQLRGGKVSVYTKDLPPHTTSNIAGGQWWPVSVFSRGTPEFREQFVAAARFAHRYFQDLVGPRWGVRWIPNYYLSEGPPTNGWMSGPGGVLHDLQVGFQDFAPGEHVFSTGHARRFFSMLIEPATYLRTLLRDVHGAGGRIVVREFATREEVLGLGEKVIFNCSGLGAAKLFGDSGLRPAKGQLSVLMPQGDVNYNLITDDHYMFPRSDGVILGGTFGVGNWDVTPDAKTAQWILDGQRKVFAEMKRLQAERGGVSNGRHAR